MVLRASCFLFAIYNLSMEKTSYPRLTLRNFDTIPQIFLATTHSKNK
jgi:hypothetical protein